MRTTFLFLLLSLAAAALLVMNARRPSPAPAKPAQSQLVSEHDWAKQALDRTAEVKRQVAQQRKERDAE